MASFQLSIRFGSFVAVTFALVACIPAEVAGAVLFGNFPPSNDDGPVQTVAPGSQVAAVFTIPDDDFLVSSVDFRLSGYTSAEDTPRIGFYKVAGSVPGALAGSLLNNPVSASSAANTFSFTGPVILTRNTAYFLLADASAGTFSWLANNPPIYPSTPLGVGFPSVNFSGFRTSTDGVNYDYSNIHSSFQINATSVPEPAEVSAVMALGLLGYAVCRQKHLMKPRK